MSICKKKRQVISQNHFSMSCDFSLYRNVKILVSIWQVLSDFDIFSVVGANKPLQVVDLRVSVKNDGLIAMRFEGVIGSPMVCGICVRKAQNIPGTVICISII